MARGRVVLGWHCAFGGVCGFCDEGCTGFGGLRFRGWRMGYDYIRDSREIIYMNIIEGTYLMLFSPSAL